MPTYTPAQVAQQVINQGGTKQQAWVAAALVDGIESSGSTTAKNPNSTACGLFQFLTTTWASNGGTAYSPTACGATWEQQIAVFLKATANNNFYDWAPDLGGSYNGNPKQAAATTPQSGSPVANKIATLASTGKLAFLGNVPANWADAGAATATTGVGSLIPGGGSSTPATPSKCLISISFGVLGKPCFLSSSQAKAITGAAALVAGSVIGALGVVMVAAAVGKSTGASAAVRSIPKPPIGPKSLGKKVAKATTPKSDSGGDDGGQAAFAEGMRQGQSQNPQHQAARRGYEREREGVRRAGAPVSKSRPSTPSVSRASSARAASTVAETAAF